MQQHQLHVDIADKNFLGVVETASDCHLAWCRIEFACLTSQGLRSYTGNAFENMLIEVEGVSG